MQDRTRRTPTIAELELALEARPSALPAMLEDALSADVAEWLGSLEPPRAREVFDQLGEEAQAEVLEAAGESLRESLVPGLGPRRLAALAGEVPPDEFVDLLELVPKSVAEDVLHQVGAERAADLRALLAHDPESAGGIMTSEFDAFPEGTRVGDAIKELRRDEEHAGDEGTGVFVVDEAGRPVGHVTDRELLTSPIHETLDAIMDRDLVLVTADEDQEQVALQLSKYDLHSVPVVDLRGRLIGVVTADDVLDVIEEEAREDFQRLVGASGREQTYLPVAKRVRQRLPLMGLTVLGGLMTAQVLDLALPDGGGDEAFVDLLRYVPIVLGLAGNVGIQSSTILVRGLATGEVTKERERAVLVSEFATGATVGVLCGAITGTVAMIVESDGALAVAFALAVGVAIAIAVAWAAALGSAVPIGCRKLGIDPAIVAGPVLVTLSDLSGTAIYMGVAQLVHGAAGVVT
ncbi:MAG: magnesium transporter [Planctomycetota bacterium]